MQYEPGPNDAARLADFRLGGFGEYIPAVVGTEVPYGLDTLQAALAERQCRLTPIPTRTPEALVVDHELNCARPGTYLLPVFASPLHRVSTTSARGVSTAFKRCAVDLSHPGLCAVELSEAGAHTVRIRMPTLLALATHPFR